MDKQHASMKKQFIWNMVGSMLHAANTVVMTALCGWLIGTEQTGIFSLAFSTALMMRLIGGFELKNIQATDVGRIFPFSNVLSFELLSNAVMLLLTVGFVFQRGYQGEKAWVILIVILGMVPQNIADCFGGMFQLNERLDITGKSLALRTIFISVSFGIALYETHNLVVATGIVAIVAMSFMVCYDLPQAKKMEECRPRWNTQKAIKLLAQAFPLFAAAFLQMYQINAPKYAIDLLLNDEMQAIYGYLFMPVAVINLFSLFLYRPMVTTLSKAYWDGDYKTFTRIIWRQIAMIAGLGFAIVAGGYLLGLPLLSILFSTNLLPYRGEFLIALTGGVFSAFNYFGYYILAVMRKQRFLMMAYLAVSLLSLVFVEPMVARYTLKGAFFAYLGMMGLVSASIALCTRWSLKKATKNSMHKKAD